MVFHGIVVDPPDESHSLRWNQSQLVSMNVQLLTGNACLLKIRLAVRPILDVLKENVECDIIILTDTHSDPSTSQVVHGHSNNGNTWLARVDTVSSTNS